MLAREIEPIKFKIKLGQDIQRDFFIQAHNHGFTFLWYLLYWLWWLMISSHHHRCCVCVTAKTSKQSRKKNKEDRSACRRQRRTTVRKPIPSPLPASMTTRASSADCRRPMPSLHRRRLARGSDVRTAIWAIFVACMARPCIMFSALYQVMPTHAFN